MSPADSKGAEVIDFARYRAARELAKAAADTLIGESVSWPAIKAAICGHSETKERKEKKWQA
jgi:hypothetical protein